MNSYKMLVNGELIDGSSSIEIVNPANEQVLAKSPVASEAQLDIAVAAASAALPGWRRTPVAERARLLRSLVNCLEKNAEELATLLSTEQGKPLAQARDEVAFSQAFASHFADIAETPVEVLLENDTDRVEVHRKPLGVVAGICPWNFPLLIAVYKIAPAVVTGNTIIVKPAPTTPLTALKLGELAQKIFPAGVLNIIADDNGLGPAISSHPGIAKLSFTGSTPTGKRIMANAADTLKRLTLELGGNDAAIVLDDANPEEAAKGIFSAAFLNSGQVCIALKRLYVHDSIYDDLCEQIAALANAAVVGNGLEPSTQFGPVQNRQQFEKVCDYIADAKANGRIIAGGTVPDAPGFCVPLTVVRDIEDGCRIVDEEPFGPVLPIIRYSDVDDVIDRANNSSFGLGGSVWSSDLVRAQQVAEQIDCGTVWINQHCAFGPHIPLASARESGIGVEFAKEGLLEYTGMKVINIKKTYSTPTH